jgi:hypothetical protein
MTFIFFISHFRRGPNQGNNPTMNILNTYTILFTILSITQAFTPHQPPKQYTTTTLYNQRPIAIAGATGRTGRLLTSTLLSQNIPVYALVRNTEKACELFDPTNDLLTIRKTDLGSEADVLKAMEEVECEAGIWCATGFSDAPDQSFWSKVRFLLYYACYFVVCSIVASGAV